jgi:hypothetical protein
VSINRDDKKKITPMNIKSRKIIKVALYILGALLVIGIIFTISDGIKYNALVHKDDIDVKLSKVFSSVCIGKGVSEAASLTAGGHSHPTLIFGSDGNLYQSAQGLGDGWNPKNISDVQMVMCVSKEEGITKVCGNQMLINISGRTAKLYEAKTAKYIDAFTLANYSCGTTKYEEESLIGIRKILEESLRLGIIHN